MQQKVVVVLSMVRCSCLALKDDANKVQPFVHKHTHKKIPLLLGHSLAKKLELGIGI